VYVVLSTFITRIVVKRFSVLLCGMCQNNISIDLNVLCGLSEFLLSSVDLIFNVF
jgi:hypothetical protein